MKKITYLLLFFLLSISGFAQKPCDDRSDSVKKIVLNDAKLISELIANFPANEYNKMIDYVSVEIKCTSNGKEITAEGLSDTLNLEQKNILKTADIGSRIKIKIKFKYKDSKNDDYGSSRKIKEMKYEVKASTLAPSGLPPCNC
ncbi:MAG: hypothetical protein Q8T03_07005 [Bacteroidota bacterium]|nr:hypothetical protein [Bacteroidota bacterium]